MGWVERRGPYAVVTVRHEGAVAELVDDELLGVLHGYEQAAAALAGMSMAVAGELARRRRAEALADVGDDASRAVRVRAMDEAEAAVADEVHLATGLGVGDARARVQLGLCAPARAGTVRAALAGGGCSWAMARVWGQETQSLPADVADQIAAVALRPTRDGAVLSYGLFRSRLGKELTRHLKARELRDFDLARRDAYAMLTPHATGEIIVSGAAERIQAAIARVDAIARGVRRRGDGRTLGQLRSDVCLDLLIFGDIPALQAPAPAALVLTGPGPAGGAAAAGGDGFVGGGELPGWVSYFPGGLPPAQLRVVISAAALLTDPDEKPPDASAAGAAGEAADAGDIREAGGVGRAGAAGGVGGEPGRLDDGSYLPAHVVRELAFAAGSTWRRLVTDPITGEALELSSTSYAPPPRLREAVHVRDGVCRAPGSTVPAHRCDLDHDRDWPAGPTTATNLSAKSRRAHGHKTRGQWATTQYPDGAIVWTTGTGRCYTTYPMQYDQTAPGRPTAEGSPRPADGSPRPRQGPPIDYRPRGSTPTTLPAPGGPARRAHPVRRTEATPEPQPDPGPPPF